MKLSNRFIAVGLVLTIPIAGMSEAVAEPTVNTNSEGQRIVQLDQDFIDQANSFALENQEAPLSETVRTVVETDYGWAPGDSDGNLVPQPRSPWGTAWRVSKCAAALTLAVAPAGAALRAIKGLGGVASAARLLVRAGNASDFGKIAGGAAAEILGIAGVQDNCF